MQYSFNHNDLKWHSLPTSSHRMKNIGIQGFSLPPFPILTLIKHSLSWHLPNYGNYLPYLNFFFFLGKSFALFDNFNIFILLAKN